MASQTKGRPQPGSKRNRYSVEFKLKAVKLYTEEGYSTEMVTGELGVGKSALATWTKRYREEGAAPCAGSGIPAADRPGGERKSR